MKLTLETQTLKKALKALKGILNDRSPHPVLTHYLFTPVDNELEISASDSISFGKIKIPVLSMSLTQPFTLKGKLISSVIAKVKDKEVSLELNERTVTLRHKGGKISIESYDTKEFPLFPDIYGEKITVESDTLIFGLNAVSFAVSDNPHQPLLGGIRIQNTESGLTFAATNGHILSTLAVANSDEFLDCVVPSELGSYLIGMDPDGELIVKSSDRLLSFKFESSLGICELASRKLEGMYPDVDKLIPSSFSKTHTVDKQLIIDKLDIAGLFYEQGDILRMTLSKDLLSLAIDSPQNSVEETIQITSQEDTDLTLGMNLKYLRDVLTTSLGKKVEFCHNEAENQPFIIKSESDGSSMINLVMPIRLA